MGQGGNVLEWEETNFFTPDDSSSFSRGVRGGAWASFSNELLSSARTLSGPSSEFPGVGFRVASIPEPSTLFLGALATVGLLMRRRRVTLPRGLASGA